MDPDAVRARLDALMTPGVPSLVAMLTLDGTPAFEYTAGFADREARTEPTLDTVYGLGSVSKTFTALAVMRLGRAGKLDVRAPASATLGDGHGVLDGVAVHHLLSHTSGLPPLDARYHALDRAAPDVFTGGTGRLADPNDTKPRHGFTDAPGLLGYLATQDVTPLGAPGSVYSYSNEGYVLLSGVVSATAGDEFERVVEATVLDAADLACTAYIGSERAAALQAVAVPYTPRENGLAPVVWWDAPAWSAPGGLLSSARDLAAFGHMLLDDPDLDAMATRHGHDTATGTAYGYGLQLRDAWEGRAVFGHGGGRVGTSASLLVAPSERAVAVALSNVAGAPVGQAAAACLAAACGQAPDATPPEGPDGLPAMRLDSAQAARLAGVYSSAEGAHLEIAADGPNLSAVIGGRPVALEAVAYDWLRAAPPAGPGIAVRFLLRDGEDAWAVRLGSRVLTREPHQRPRSAP